MAYLTAWVPAFPVCLVLDCPLCLVLDCPRRYQHPMARSDSLISLQTAQMRTSYLSGPTEEHKQRGM